MEESCLVKDGFLPHNSNLENITWVCFSYIYPLTIFKGNNFLKQWNGSLCTINNRNICSDIAVLV